MMQEFFGPWSIEVHSKDAAYSQRFIVEGSVGSDGIYPGDIGTPVVAVSADAWTIRFEWNDNAGSGWQPSNLRRVAAEYTLAAGLVIFLGVDDNLPALRDDDFDDLIVRCRSLDPDVNPWMNSPGLPDFSLSNR
jgi:hypothetical protein